MSRARTSLFFALCWLPFVHANECLAADRPGSIPSYIASRFSPSSDPAWVSAASVTDGQGHLIRESLSSQARDSIDRQIAGGYYQKNGCLQFLGTVEDQAGPVKAHSSLKDLAQNSLAIVRGTVTDIDRGFSQGWPALLLEVRVEEKIKDTSKASVPAQIYIPYPKGNFEMGEYRFCVGNWKWPEPPQVGDEILFFPYRAPYDANGSVFVPNPDAYELFFVRKKSGILEAPQGVKEDEDLIGVRDIEVLKRSVLRTLKAPAEIQEH